ncbi:uncharacterized protein LOC131031599 isoform X2 [Cryptomeria japonica]|nr:uncharacterized protein LOC131031599 isoform X2 [Cryptomeria japonica]XP_057818737.2 uncharacterized protein LOC131031599 isoform X2 [Cryptomeria japonica]
MLCMLETLMPLMGTSVPSPTILAVSYCSSELEIEKAHIINSEEVSGFKPFELPAYTEKAASSMLLGQSTHALETAFISVSDDGKVWKWSLTAEVPGDVHSQEMNETVSRDPIQQSDKEILINLTETQVDGYGEEESEVSQQLHTSIFSRGEPIFQLKLTGQLHLISSTITTVAVPAPSLTATSPGGSNGQAVAVPLVALATQGGCIEVIDVAATAVSTSFSVHNSAIRGLRWLGNSRLVSFSYTQVNEKAGGYINKLAVTCVRSGISRFFRVLQKPERTPMRALRASPSGRYLLILFREAPVEVWAMTRNPQMLRSLALPFTVMEWALPPVPKPQQKSSSQQPSNFSKEQPIVASNLAATSAHSANSKSGTSEGAAEETGESFAFALVNGSIGVFEVRGRRIRDFRPKWPTSSFVSPDALVTAMAYRLPHVVMGNRLGNIRWWDVISGQSSSFNTHRGGIRRIKFAPVVVGDQSRGRVAVLFNDNTFSIYDLDTQDPLANAILQPQFAGILVLELDWFPLRFDKKEPLLLCLAGADSSFRLLEVNTNLSKSVQVHEGKVVKDRFRPMPLCSPALLPPPHALAFRMLLQWGVQPSWFDAHISLNDIATTYTSGIPLTLEQKDLRKYMLDTTLPVIGDLVVPELLLKILEPYRKAGRLFNNDRIRRYTSLLGKGCTARFAFAAIHFGEFSEALFWLQLPHILSCLTEKIHEKSLKQTKSIKPSAELTTSEALHIAKSTRRIASLKERKDEVSDISARSLQDCSSLPTLQLPYQGSGVTPSGQGALYVDALERISWHGELGGGDASQKRVHELVAVGDLEAAVTLLLSTPPDSPYFYVDALRAVALSSAVSSALYELAVKVVAANMVGTDKSFSGIHLLCAVGCYQEACSQLQDAGCWADAATLAASHLQGSDYARVLQRWADHVLYDEHNIWRALILYVTAGALHKALAVLRDSHEPDTAAMFLLACHEIKAKLLSEMSGAGSVAALSSDEGQGDAKTLDLPNDLNQEQEDVLAVCEYYGQYQRTLVHLCTDLSPVLD